LFALIAENLTTENVQGIGKMALVQKSFAKVLGIAVIESSFSDNYRFTANNKVDEEISLSASVKRKRSL
jgi:hypothetical protein